MARLANTLLELSISFIWKSPQEVVISMINRTFGNNQGDSQCEFVNKELLYLT